MHHLLNFARDDSGSTAIEYAIMAGLMSVVIIGALTSMGTKLNAKFSSFASNLT